MKEEYQSLLQNETWELVERPKDRKVIDSKWVFKIKRELDRAIVCYKARFVAKGYTQMPGIDYDNTYSPTISHSALRIMYTIALNEDMEIHQMDVKTAFLNGEVDKELYVEQAEGFDHDPRYPRRQYVYKLKKELYKLKQGPLLQNQTLHKYLIENGYQQLEAEPCIYIKKEENKKIIIAVYVDDLQIASNDDKLLKETKKILSSRFEMTDMGQVHHILGLQIQYEKGKKLTIDQSHYTEKILERFGMKNCNPISTPADNYTHLRAYQDEDQDTVLMDNTRYRSAVGALMYLAIATRPDIAFAVNRVARFVERPTITHWTAVKRIMRYLRGTTNCGLVFEKKDKETNNLKAYCDSDWAGDLDDRKSTTGFVLILNDSIIS